MPIITDIANWVKNRFIYMTGRGLVGVGIMLGAGFVGAGSSGLLIAAVAGTAGVQAFMTYRNERRKERQILSEYREEVGATLGMNPADVTLENLKQIAEGNPEAGLPGNSIIKEALDTNAKRHMMQFITSALAGVTTLALAAGAFMLFGVDLTDETKELRKTVYQTMVPDGSVQSQFMNWVYGLMGREAGNISLAASSMFIAGTGMGVLNQAFDRVGERMLNIHKDTAHKRIMDIKRDLARGKLISQEQVFGVFVSADEGLSACIEEEFGKHYDKLNQRQQHLALEQFGRGKRIGQITYEINHLMIEPEELAFKAVGQSSGVPPKRDIDLKHAVFHEVTTKELVDEFKKAFVGDAPAKPKPQEPASEPVTEKSAAQAPANDNQQGFAERFVPREQEKTQSFAERHAPKHSDQLTHVERLKAQIDALGPATDHKR